MNRTLDTLQLVRPTEARQALGRWIRLARQRGERTQPMLAAMSGVPVATLSRLEREGRGSIDALVRVLQALGELDRFDAFVQERIRLASLPSDLAALQRKATVVQRVRVRKAAKGGGA